MKRLEATLRYSVYFAYTYIGLHRIPLLVWLLSRGNHIVDLQNQNTTCIIFPINRPRNLELSEWSWTNNYLVTLLKVPD